MYCSVMEVALLLDGDSGNQVCLARAVLEHAGQAEPERQWYIFQGLVTISQVLI